MQEETVYGFKEKRIAETLRDMAQSPKAGASSSGACGLDNGSRTFVCVPDEDVPAASKAGDGTIFPGYATVTIYELGDDGAFTPRPDEAGEPLKLTAYSLVEEPIEAGTFCLTAEDSFGRLFFCHKKTGTAAVFVQPEGYFFGWLDDQRDYDRPEPILADYPAGYSLYLSGDSQYPAERTDADFKAAALDARGRLWRWVKTADGWYVSETLPDGKKYVQKLSRPAEIYHPEEVFGGKYTSDTLTLWPADFGSGTYWRNADTKRNLYSDGIWTDGTFTYIYEGYMLAYTIYAESDGVTFTAHPTETYFEITGAETLTLTYSRSVYPLTDYTWTDSMGEERLFGVPYWSIDGTDFHLAPAGDGTAYQLEGSLTVDDQTFSALTWNANREEWILGRYGDPAGWYSVKAQDLDITDGWKWSGSLAFQKPEDTEEPEERPALALTYKEIRPETFKGPALVIHPERLKG